MVHGGNIDVDFLVREEEKKGLDDFVGEATPLCNLIRPPLKLVSFFFSRPNRKVRLTNIITL